MQRFKRDKRDSMRLMTVSAKAMALDSERRLITQCRAQLDAARTQAAATIVSAPLPTAPVYTPPPIVMPPPIYTPPVM
jgi:hypothetical protein